MYVDQYMCVYIFRLGIHLEEYSYTCKSHNHQQKIAIIFWTQIPNVILAAGWSNRNTKKQRCTSPCELAATARSGVPLLGGRGWNQRHWRTTPLDQWRRYQPAVAHAECLLRLSMLTLCLMTNTGPTTWKQKVVQPFDGRGERHAAVPGARRDGGGEARSAGLWGVSGSASTARRSVQRSGPADGRGSRRRQSHLRRRRPCLPWTPLRQESTRLVVFVLRKYAKKRVQTNQLSLSCALWKFINIRTTRSSCS